jgi:hypothetical protein
MVSWDNGAAGVDIFFIISFVEFGANQVGRLIRRRWNSASTGCRMRRPARGASRSPAITSSGNPTTREVISVVSIQRQAK